MWIALVRFVEVVVKLAVELLVLAMWALMVLVEEGCGLVSPALSCSLEVARNSQVVGIHLLLEVRGQVHPPAHHL